MPRIVISIAGKKPQPYRFPLDRERTTLGRSLDNDIVIDDPSVSSFHAEMQRVKGGVILKDIGSTNGIKLAGEEMEVIELVPDIDVLVGDVSFEAEFSAEELAELEGEDGPSRQKAKEPALPPLAKPAKVEEIPEPEVASVDLSNRSISSETEAGATHKGLSTFTVILLAALAFFIGLAVRHYVETGQFILN